jgi:murein DD-endopeptidase MepM/ murein hydrolase activator NlpD
MQKITKKNLFIHVIIMIIMGSFIFAPVFYVFAQLTQDDISNEINNLTKDINSKKQEIGDIEAQISKYQTAIRNKQNEQNNLSNQIDILDDQISKTELEVRKIQEQVNQINLEIKLNQDNIKQTNDRIQKVRLQIGEFIRTMNRRDDKSYIEVVVNYGSLSDFFSEITYLENFESDLKSGLDRVKELKTELDVEQSDLNNRQTKLSEVKQNLADKRDDLSTNQNTKSYLLDQTKRDEVRYQQLLKEEKAFYEKTNNEIAYLEKTIREKMADSGQLGDISKSGMIWPILSHRITAYFHDPDYPYRHIFEHPAIDIASPQGTTIKAVASGYVARAKDAGMGYSYIMLIHDNGISTVYGHVSKILVDEETYVVQGQSIALSGATPGTPGAGRLTTGPHLHFEVRLNGIPVNPLNYLAY